MNTTIRTTGVALMSAILASPALAQDPAPADPVAAATAALALKQAKLDYNKARYDIPASGLTGAVATGEGAGLAEGVVLTNAAMSSAAAEIAKSYTTGCPTIFMYPGAEHPDFAEAQAHRFQVGRLKAQLASAIEAAGPSLPRPGKPPTGYKSFLPVGAAISAGVGLLSFFKSDYTVGGAKLEPDNNKFSAYLASALSLTGRKIYLTSEFSPPLSSTLTSDFAALDDLATKALDRARVLEVEAAQAKDKPEAPILEAKLKRLTDAIGSYQAYVGSVLAANDAGDRSLARLNKQMAIQETPGACYLGYTVSNSVASNYTRKNIFSTVFGGMPFYVAGTVDVTYRSWGPDNEILKYAVVRRSTKYLKARDVLTANAEVVVPTKRP